MALRQNRFRKTEAIQWVFVAINETNPNARLQTKSLNPPPIHPLCPLTGVLYNSLTVRISLMFDYIYIWNEEYSDHA